MTDKVEPYNNNSSGPKGKGATESDMKDVSTAHKYP